MRRHVEGQKQLYYIKKYFQKHNHNPKTKKHLTKVEQIKRCKQTFPGKQKKHFERPKHLEKRD